VGLFRDIIWLINSSLRVRPGPLCRRPNPARLGPARFFSGENQARPGGPPGPCRPLLDSYVQVLSARLVCRVSTNGQRMRSVAHCARFCCTAHMLFRYFSVLLIMSDNARRRHWAEWSCVDGKAAVVIFLHSTRRADLRGERVVPVNDGWT
jgi:hypothetical protein